MAQRDPPDSDPLTAAIQELQNVLTVIRGHAQIVQRRLGREESTNPDGLAACMGVIDEATRRMAVTIGRLPELNRRQATSDDEATPPHPLPPTGDG